MPNLFKLVLASIIAIAISGPIVLTKTVAAQAADKEVPFGDKVGPAVTNYNRLRPNIATAGVLKDGAVQKLKSLGFATILDLRGAEEGADLEKRLVEAAGLRYLQ